MPLNRRKFLTRSAATGAGVALAGAAAPAAQAAGSAEAAGSVAAAGGGEGGKGKPVKRYALTVMGTTDLHGHVFNWDYFKDAEYEDGAGNAQGLARVSTLVEQVRREKGRHHTMLLDAGDTIQGTPLTYYYAKVDPITAKGGPVHPMARAMNAIGYDAVALGNHEFNYGIETLRKFEEQCRFPVVGCERAGREDVEAGVPAVFHQGVPGEGRSAGAGGGAGVDRIRGSRSGTRRMCRGS
ncbi:hypothetical protein SHIRM173S_05783 [Streptomyces hirsutus]